MVEVTEKHQAMYRVMRELENFTLEEFPYTNNSSGYQESIDSLLLGRVLALREFCKTFGWEDLSSSLIEFSTTKGVGVVALTHIRGFVIPEIIDRIKKEASPADSTLAVTFWDDIHPLIVTVSKQRFESGFYSDAVEAAYKEINDRVKSIYKAATGKESDGAGLMTTALSINNPTIKLNTLETESQKNQQKGYMQIFAGVMTAIRNPSAHANTEITKEEAIHLVYMGSHLLHILDKRI